MFEDCLHEDSSEGVPDFHGPWHSSNRAGRISHAPESFLVLSVPDCPCRGCRLPSEGGPPNNGLGLASFQIGLHRMDGSLAVPPPGNCCFDYLDVEGDRIRRCCFCGWLA